MYSIILNSKRIIYFLLLLMPIISFAQNPSTTGGAQGGALGISDCYPHESICTEEYDAEIFLILITDSNAQETSWQIEDQTDGTIIGSGDNLVSDSTYQELFCARTDHCYRFTIFDSGGSGIDTAQNKGYSIYWNGDLKKSGGDFGANDSVSFGACCTNFSVELQGGIQCINSTEGQVLVETSGGTPPFDYLWSNGATFTETQFVTIGEDKISVTVTDAGNCMASDTLLIADLNSLEFELKTSPVETCNSNTGEASVSVLSGIPPFRYAWSSGGSKQTERNLPTGTYSVTVTDASHCIVESIVTILDPSPIVITVDSIISGTSDNNNGAIYITVTGGSGQIYSYSWSDESNTIISEVEDPVNLPAGTYTVTVTDSQGCSVTHTIVATDIDDISNSTELEKLISLAPNPTDGRVLLRLDLNGYHDVQIAVYDSRGRQIITIPQKKIQFETFEWDLSNYSTGVYFFKILVDGRVVIKKLVYSN